MLHFPEENNGPVKKVFSRLALFNEQSRAYRSLVLQEGQGFSYKSSFTAPKSK